LVQLYEFDDSLGVRARQEATTRIGEAVAKEFGATSSYFSVIGSDDVDGLPFYTDDAGVWGRIHANFAHDEDDF
jgi:hypothetical protein